MCGGRTSTLWAFNNNHCAIGAECLVVLVVNEREECAVVLHLPFGPLTTHHCAIGAECLVVCVSC